MNPFKCRHCDKPAHFYFREGGMLCVDHGALHATAQMKDMLERSRLDKSACASLEGCPSRSSSEVSPGLSGVPAQGRPLTPFDDLPIFPERRNATTFRVTADNSIQASASSFSMGTAGHGGIVDAHNTIVRGG